ncbi:MAG TPA: response regulator transcription factor [Pseudonocardia sp.]|jgi:DNA-binding NarL/FixJ family response regulator|nr:response regulator transcription factor [Pseudonocardia sp.]
MIRVIVADDHAVVRHGLRQLLETAPDIEVVAVAADGEEAVALVGEHLPDVVLMDLAMPVMNGIEATRRIVSGHPDVRVVILTSFGDEARILEALDAGARGYLLKHLEPDALIDAVRAVDAGEAPLDPRAGRVLLDRQRARSAVTDLSQREREVLTLVTEGLANKQVARRLGISERTVKAHLTNVFQRIKVTDRVQAAIWAREHLR